MQESLIVFSEWLSATPFSVFIQSTSWIIPAVQSIHILSIAIVMSSALMIALRVLGWTLSDQSIDEVMRRFLPWIWGSLIVLLVSGTLLIVAEPGRSLTNSVFQLKMLLLVGVIACTLFLRQPLKANVLFWEATSPARVGSKLIAVLSLTLWSGIIFAGRWIAYAGDGV